MICFQVACAQKFQTKNDFSFSLKNDFSASKYGILLLICKNLIRNDTE